MTTASLATIAAKLYAGGGWLVQNRYTARGLVLAPNTALFHSILSAIVSSSWNVMTLADQICASSLLCMSASVDPAFRSSYRSVALPDQSCQVSKPLLNGRISLITCSVLLPGNLQGQAESRCVLCEHFIFCAQPYVAANSYIEGLRWFPIAWLLTAEAWVCPLTMSYST